MIALFILGALFGLQAVLFERERSGWHKERTFLTNAALAKSQTDFVVRQAATVAKPRPAPRVVASLDDLPADVDSYGPVTAMPLGL